MARWEADGSQRLQRAAMELFTERGYAAVTVAEIASRAGLTKRSFFNHFPDKREVLFAGAPALEAEVLAHLASQGVGDPLEVAVLALTGGAQTLAGYVGFARARSDLIASSAELQERNLIKLASLAAAIGGGLHAQGTEDPRAAFAAQAAVSVFCAAYDRWAEDPAADIAFLMRECLAEFRAAVLPAVRATTG